MQSRDELWALDDANKLRHDGFESVANSHTWTLPPPGSEHTGYRLMQANVNPEYSTISCGSDAQHPASSKSGKVSIA